MEAEAPINSARPAGSGSDQSAVVDTSLERERVDLEQEKLKQDTRLRELELALKAREIDLADAEQKASRWRSPLIVAIMATALGLFGNITVTYLQNRANQETVQEKARADLVIARNKAQSDLILEAIRTGNPQKAEENLLFFIQAGLIDDPEGKIRQWLSSKDRQSPTLPSPAASPLSGLTAHISGIVVDAFTGRPILAARLSFSRLADPTIRILEVITDKEGAFSVALPQGTFRAQVEAEGYITRKIGLLPDLRDYQVTLRLYPVTRP